MWRQVSFFIPDHIIEYQWVYEFIDEFEWSKNMNACVLVYIKPGLHLNTNAACENKVIV